MVTPRPLPPGETTDLPPLPKGKRPSFSSHRNDANAALAVDRLAEVHDAITGWHQTLRQTLLDIQALYQAGPIIEGWLESVASSSPEQTAATSAGLLRHGDPAAISAYVDQLSQAQPTLAARTGNSQYRLCRLNEEGQLHCQPCPPDQLGAISQAIARHQRLRQLVLQKQTLEEKLQKAGESLGRVRTELGLTDA
ncbi:MAG: hypothetical protein O2890_00130 [Cyanobacteria bacterium]|nr:hypothetical protein [Cyanobacteriota bacterium]MDA0864841.1 hypothetical protein [Cyanobacteriota bacterium]